MDDAESLFWFSQLPSDDVRSCLHFLKMYRGKQGAELLFENLIKRKHHARLMRSLMRGFIDGKAESPKENRGIQSIKISQIKNLFKARFIDKENPPCEERPHQTQSETEVAARESAAWESWCEAREEGIGQEYQAFSRERAKSFTFQPFEKREPSFEPKKGLRKKDKTNGGNVFNFEEAEN